VLDLLAFGRKRLHFAETYPRSRSSPTNGVVVLMLVL
jgi:hypothetical protein